MSAKTEKKTTASKTAVSLNDLLAKTVVVKASAGKIPTDVALSENPLSDIQGKKNQSNRRGDLRDFMTGCIENSIDGIFMMRDADPKNPSKRGRNYYFDPDVSSLKTAADIDKIKNDPNNIVVIVNGHAIKDVRGVTGNILA